MVHEAYLRLVGVPQEQAWDHRGHFFAAAAEAMRRIMVDQARRKSSEKRGGDRQRVELDEGVSAVDSNDSSPDDLLALNEALDELAAAHPVKAQLVKLRYFAGLSLEEAAQTIGVSNATAKRYWVYARSWLYGKLQGD